jgi:tRNA pseudouridine38-40 synthase
MKSTENTNQTGKNYKLTIAYDGSRYYGWEHQPDRDTIQGKLETVLMRMCGMEEIPEVIGAGRTDAGVHAKAMVASVLLATDLSPQEIKDYMNRYLPDDIGVVDVREASLRFHARYNAVGKTYSYTCYVGDGKPVFQRKYVTRLEAEPNLDAMLRAASYLQGEHDFKSFCGNPRMKKSTVRLVDSIAIKRSKNQIYFTFHGTGFLQHMVRILVGTLLEVGYGRMQPEDMPALLEARDRSLAGPTAPACGLCLEKVDY